MAVFVGTVELVDAGDAVVFSATLPGEFPDGQRERVNVEVRLLRGSVEINLSGRLNRPYAISTGRLKRSDTHGE